jgi:hypothetical protein
VSLLDDATLDGRLVSVDFSDAITQFRVTRSMSQAHTVEFNVTDPGRVLLESNLWAQRSNLRLGDHQYVLVRWEKQSFTDHFLVFEDYTTYAMRTHKKIKRAFRDRVNRAQFVGMLCRESGVPFFCPESPPPAPTTVPNVSSSGQDSGFDSGFHPTIKGSLANKAQLATMNAVLDAAFSPPVNAPERAVVALVMAVTQESSFHERAQARSHNGFQLGVLQQASTTGWHGLFDPVLSVQEFMLGKLTSPPTASKRTFAGGGFLSYYTSHLSEGTTAEGLAAQIERVQGSGLPQLYATHYAEAQRTVEGFQRTTPHRGLLLQDKFAFTVGRPGAKEDYWSAAVRIAQEIGWYLFVLGGRVWMVSPEWLFAAPAKATLREGEGAVGEMTWQLDANSPLDTMQVQVYDGWTIHPGVTVKIEGQGPASGKWLIAEWERDGFRPDGTLTLAKPGETIPEPVGDQTGTGWKPAHRGTSDAAAPFPGAPPTSAPTQYPVGTATVQPIPQGITLTVGGQHDTSGLPNHPARDWLCPAGSPVVACETGIITRYSGRDPATGLQGKGTAGDPHGAFGWSMYLKGNSGAEYYYTHLGDRVAVENQHVQVGQLIAHVGDFKRWGGADHVHMGVQPPVDGSVDIDTIYRSPRPAAAPHAATAPPTAPPPIGQRENILSWAKFGVDHQDRIRYKDGIDLSKMLTIEKVVRDGAPGLDCVTYIVLCYKGASAPDPTGGGYGGRDDIENTAHLLSHCTHITQAAAVAGDLVVFGSAWTNPDGSGLGHHAAILKDNGPANSNNPNLYSHGGNSTPEVVSFTVESAAQSAFSGIQFLRCPGLVS